MQQLAGSWKRRGYRVGFVPTMGALHEGHLSLIRQARKNNKKVIVSIFVNPTQFGPKEDFKKYPRNLSEDARLCRKEGVDVVFCPSAVEMYPSNYKTYVEIEDLSAVLCGEFRPGHFRGVATVVTKLFNIVQPDIAYLGQKDAQQAIIIKRMARDLNMPLRIEIVPTRRDRDGLALSSRNRYLTAAERKSAAVLNRALNLGHKLVADGNRNSRKIITKLKALIRKSPRTRIQYLEIVDPQDLRPVARIKGQALIALAVYLGKTRLIDNIIVRG